MTPQGYARLKRELMHLLDVERPELVKVVSWAASNGDRSENGDYLYGKKRLREIDRRIHYLNKRLDRVTPTAAHRSLPLASYAKVTSLDTGRSVVVKINDRGPQSRRFISISARTALSSMWRLQHKA